LVGWLVGWLVVCPGLPLGLPSFKNKQVVSRVMQSPVVPVCAPEHGHSSSTDAESSEWGCVLQEKEEQPHVADNIAVPHQHCGSSTPAVAAEWGRVLQQKEDAQKKECG